MLQPGPKHLMQPGLKQLTSALQVSAPGILQTTSADCLRHHHADEHTCRHCWRQPAGHPAGLLTKLLLLPASCMAAAASGPSPTHVMAALLQLSLMAHGKLQMQMQTFSPDYGTLGLRDWASHLPTGGVLRSRCGLGQNLAVRLTWPAQALIPACNDQAQHAHSQCSRSYSNAPCRPGPAARFCRVGMVFPALDSSQRKLPRSN